MPLLLIPFVLIVAIVAIAVTFAVTNIPVLVLYVFGLGIVYLFTGNWPTFSIDPLYQTYGAHSEISHQVDFMSSLLSNAVGRHQLLVDAESWNIIYGLPVFMAILFLLPCAVGGFFLGCIEWWDKNRKQNGDDAPSSGVRE